MDTKKLFSLFFAFAVFLSLFAPVAVRADIASGVGTGTEMGSDATKPYRRDENYIDVQPDDIDIWDNGKGISISGGGQTYSVDYSRYASEYAVLVSKYLDADGEYTVQVDIYFYGRYSYVCRVETNKVYVSEDGSSYSPIFVKSVNSFDSGGDYYRVKLRDGLFGASDGNWMESPCFCLRDSFTSGSGDYCGSVYLTPFFGGKYLVYSSYETVSSDSAYVGFPVNLLPNAPLGAGSTNIPYKTTFRMLTGETTVYNTFYYTSSYMSGADEISASGTIRLDATKLVDGSVTRTRPSAPQLLCQKSSYGTAYDIVYTNDDNLCSLLGIEKPNELRWNVKMQAWVSPAWDDMINGTPDIGNLPETDVINPDGSSPFENAESIPTVAGLSVSTSGQDAQLKYSDYSKLYGNALMHVSASPSSAADAWGLGSLLRWSLDGDSGGFDVKLQIVAKVSVQLSDGTTKSHQLILQDYDGTHPGNNTAFHIGAADGKATIALYDLIITLENKYKEYISSPPTRFLGVVYYLTPFYYKDGTYYRGAPVSVAHSVNKTFASVPVAPVPTNPPDNAWDFSTDGIEGISNFLKNIGAMLVGIPSFLVDLLGTFGELISKVGEVPLLLGTLFTFLPSELLTVIRLGVLACVVIGVIRWIRG